MADCPAEAVCADCPLVPVHPARWRERELVEWLLPALPVRLAASRQRYALAR
jgi:hypothetical protein